MYLIITGTPTTKRNKAMEKLSLKLNLALRQIKSNLFFWTMLTILLSSCGFQHRRYTSGWHWNSATSIVSHVAAADEPSLAHCEEKVALDNPILVSAIPNENRPLDSISVKWPRNTRKIKRLFCVVVQEPERVVPSRN